MAILYHYHLKSVNMLCRADDQCVAVVNHLTFKEMLNHLICLY